MHNLRGLLLFIMFILHLSKHCSMLLFIGRQQWGSCSEFIHLGNLTKTNIFNSQGPLGEQGSRGEAGAKGDKVREKTPQISPPPIYLLTHHPEQCLILMWDSSIRLLNIGTSNNNWPDRVQDSWRLKCYYWIPFSSRNELRENNPLSFSLGKCRTSWRRWRARHPRKPRTRRHTWNTRTWRGESESVLL